ncbi:hypothetical protein LN040_04190 [Desulfovibrio subterraneus]|uniref:hypothetical protein n=1 Tax=Desulfovibrio subterraneus TaxID=2718620 RepID=UPI0022B8B65C|nr:hypothetical protein [Desulfovibrio subterraneus]WBF68310.1 hypothetical protein LN040_04190 [Desulfovibrio subterraneus]
MPLKNNSLLTKGFNMLDLFDDVVDKESQHPNYVSIKVDKKESVREIITKWTDGFTDRDNKIVKEFQTTFNSSFWEFYLNAALTKLGFSIDMSFDRPDFIISKNDMTIAAEATITNNPEGAAPEWSAHTPPQIDPEYRFKRSQLAKIRLLNSIHEKHKKYTNNYSKLDHVKDKPFIICIAPFEQPFFFTEGDSAIRQTLYKVDVPIYQHDESTDTVRIIGMEKSEKAIKHNGVEIELGLFSNDKMKEISAILFSNTATMTKANALCSDKLTNTIFYSTRYNEDNFGIPDIEVKIGGEYKESLLEGLHLFLNPFAENKLDTELFDNEDVTIHSYDFANNQYNMRIKNGTLLSHGSLTPYNKGEVTGLKPKIDVEYQDVYPELERDKIYELGGTVGLGINNNIAHYFGWTIVIFQDDVDKDWGAIAKHKKVYTLQHFINLKENYGWIQDIAFYKSKEDAYNATKKLIDTKLSKGKRIQTSTLTPDERRKLRNRRRNARTRRK